MENTNEYLMLRDEILHLDTIVNNTINFFYVFISAYLAFALGQQDNLLLLLSYMVIIPAYLIVMSKMHGMARIGAYLKVFREGPETFMWETRNMERRKQKTKKTIFNFIIAANFPFIFVSFTVTVLYVARTNLSCMDFYEKFKLMICFFAFLLVIVITLRNRELSVDDYIETWEKVKNKE